MLTAMRDRGCRLARRTSQTALARAARGHAFTVPEVTFRKITDEERDDWQTRFAGIRT